MKVLVTIPFTEVQKQRIAQMASDVEYIGMDKVQPQDVENKEVVIGNIPKSYLESAKNLKWLQLSMSGYEGYPQLMPKGAILTNSRGAFGLAISEHMLGMLLMLKKRLHQYHNNQKKALWQAEGKVTSVYESKVLIVGLGNIGSEFSIRVKALGAYTIGIKRDISKKAECIDELYTLDKIDELIPKADVIALSIPNDKDTYKLMNEKRISLMKQGAILLNVGRGAAVDTDALTRAISEGKIMAGLDVTDPEPLPKDHPLWKEENCIITPHISGFFYLPKTLENIVDIALENLSRYVEKKELNNIIR